MPRYIIERVFGDAVEEDMGRIGSHSRRIIEQEFPDVTWEHSYVVSDEASGGPGIKTLCVYEAPSEERIRRHAEILGEHEITNLYEIGGVVTPADFAG
jgi:Nickel responsive protein SCO4226-like